VSETGSNPPFALTHSLLAAERRQHDVLRVEEDGETMGRTSRRVTDPPRGLTPEALEDLGREERRQLVQSLLVQEGRRVIEIDRKADFDDFLVETVPLWHTHVARVRVLYREASEMDFEDLQALASSKGNVDAVLIETSARSSSWAVSGVEHLQATDLIERLEASPVVEWEGAIPTVSKDRFALFKDVNKTPLSLDVLGLRWLPALALNKVPADLQPGGVAADALFEEAVYRVFTMVFRFSGKRLGSKAPGSRDPDALLGDPAAATASFHAMLDCKAARDGYRMSADDERRFIDLHSPTRPGESCSTPQVPCRSQLILPSRQTKRPLRKAPRSDPERDRSRSCVHTGVGSLARRISSSGDGS